MLFRVTVQTWDENSASQYPPIHTILDIRRTTDPSNSIISALAWEDDNRDIPLPSWDPELSKED